MLSRNNPDQSGQECNGSRASWAGSGTEPRGGACLLKPHLLSDQTNFSRAGRQHCRQGGRCVWHQHWFWTVRQRCRVTIAAGRTADKSDPIPRCRGENHHQLPDNVPPFIFKSPRTCRGLNPTCLADRAAALDRADEDVAGFADQYPREGPLRRPSRDFVQDGESF